MRYSPGELAILLKQSTENIRLWSIEFASHLSKSAVPEKRGKHRSYDENDVSVLALVADYTNRNIPFEQIHKALTDGERLMPSLASIDRVGQEDKTLALQNRIQELEAEIVELTAKYHETEGQRSLLEKMLEKAHERLFRRDW